MPFLIGPTIAVSGEKEYNIAMRNIRDSMKYVSAEAALATSEFSKNDKSVEALTARNEGLKKSLDIQKSAVNAAQDALDKMKANGVEPTIKAYQQMEANLNNAKSALNRTEVEIRENEQSMDDLSKKSSGLGDNLKGLAEKFGITLPAGAQKGIDALNNISASTVAFAAIAVKAISTLVKFSTEAAKSADNILTMSSTTGLSTQKLQELQYASEFVDVSLETMTGSMTKMIRSMDTARSGSNETANAYRKLGIRVTDTGGELRDVNTVFYEAIDKLGKVKNETERDAIAMQLFGKSARELNPLIEAGSARMAELAEEANKMGYVMSEETLGKLGALDDAMQKFSKSGETVKNTLALALLPILTAVMDVISAIPPDVIAVIAVLGTVAVTVVAVVKSVKAVTGIIETFSAASWKTTGIVLGVVAALIALVAIIAVLSGKSSELNKAMSSVGSSVSQVRGDVSNARNIPQYASGTFFHPGGRAIVGERGPEEVWLPRGTAVIPNGGFGGDTYHISINANEVREFNDIVKIAQNARMSKRQGYKRGYKR